MNYKCTNQNQLTQAPVAGVLLDDHNIEFVGCRSTKKVIWLQRGNAHEFKHLPNRYYQLLRDAFLKDEFAHDVLLPKVAPLEDPERRMVELFTYYMYGDLNNTPDIVDGKLMPCENFREEENCISLKFSTKTIDINGVPLKREYIFMLDAYAHGVPDKAIAGSLGKALTTLDFHKSKLFKILGVHSKPEAVSAAYKHGVLCAH